MIIKKLLKIEIKKKQQNRKKKKNKNGYLLIKKYLL